MVNSELKRLGNYYRTRLLVVSVVLSHERDAVNNDSKHCCQWAKRTAIWWSSFHCIRGAIRHTTKWACFHYFWMRCDEIFKVTGLCFARSPKSLAHAISQRCSSDLGNSKRFGCSCYCSCYQYCSTECHIPWIGWSLGGCMAACSLSKTRLYLKWFLWFSATYRIVRRIVAYTNPTGTFSWSRKTLINFWRRCFRTSMILIMHINQYRRYPPWDSLGEYRLRRKGRVKQMESFQLLKEKRGWKIRQRRVWNRRSDVMNDLT